jgi:hypothetical protein
MARGPPALTLISQSVPLIFGESLQYLGLMIWRIMERFCGMLLAP